MCADFGAAHAGSRIIEGMDTVTVVWSMIAAFAALLGIVHLARWALDRESRVDLTFSLVAFCFVGVAFGELVCMHALTAADWGEAVRWLHVPLWGLVVFTVLFVHQYLGAGKPWLVWAIIGVRTVILAINFATDSNFNFAKIHSIERAPFLGERVSVVGEAVTGRFQILGLISSVLLVAYVLEATVTLWRRGGADDRRRAVTIGGSVCAFTLIASSATQLVIWQVAQLPFLITPAFAVPLLAMSMELGRDLLRASALARALRETRSRLELAAGSANLGLWEWNGQTGRVWATGKACEMFGLTAADTADYRHWLDRVHPDDVPRLVHEMERALASGAECSVEFRILTGGAEPRWILARGRAEASLPGKRAHVRGVVRDVSEERRAQCETQELRQELMHTGRVSLLGQLSSSLAHELSQPLGAILRNSEAAAMMLRAPTVDREELQAIVADIQRDDRRAGQVIDRLRALLKWRQVELLPTSVDGLIQDVLTLVRPDASLRHVYIESRLTPGLPAVDGDRVHLSQVLLNLFLNAMDAVSESPPDRWRVVVGARQRDARTVEIYVSDSGPGVPEDRIGKIFDPFFTTKASGMGMGLSVSRAIVESHGGQIDVRNETEGGATFSVTLPVAEAARP